MFIVTVPGTLSGVAGVRATATTLVATGTLSVTGGGSVNLTGTYDQAASTFSITGSGYTLSGNVKTGTVAGTYTGPSAASGQLAGLDSTAITATSFCGTYAGDDTGSFNVTISSAGPLNGLAYSNKGGVVTALAGSVSNGALSLTTSEGVRVTGTVSGTRVSGSFTGGTFSGSSDGCR